MGKELAVNSESASFSPAIQQTGTNNFNVVNQAGGSVIINTTAQVTQSTETVEKMLAVSSFSKEYYQLIVTQDKVGFLKNRVMIPTSQALVKGTVPPEIYRRCSSLTDSGIEELKHFPAIVCLENRNYHGITTPDEYAVYAYFREIRVMGEIINISFVPLGLIKHSVLCDKKNAAFFDLNMDCAITDLNICGWTVHKTDLFEAFRRADIVALKPD